jgi:hypothetical protein
VPQANDFEVSPTSLFAYLPRLFTLSFPLWHVRSHRVHVKGGSQFVTFDLHELQIFRPLRFVGKAAHNPFSFATAWNILCEIGRRFPAALQTSVPSPSGTRVQSINESSVRFTP